MSGGEKIGSKNTSISSVEGKLSPTISLICFLQGENIISLHYSFHNPID